MYQRFNTTESPKVVAHCAQIEFRFYQFGKKIEKSLSSIIDDKATIYDEQIDKFYNETHIGGFTYRHFEKETGT